MWAIYNKLCYTQHGGSGYSFTREDVRKMTWDEAMYHSSRLDERRAHEAKILGGKK